MAFSVNNMLRLFTRFLHKKTTTNEEYHEGKSNFECEGRVYMMRREAANRLTNNFMLIFGLVVFLFYEFVLVCSADGFS